ncbi:triple tyrosine motif-containing protein [Leeuwenhoekiella sp. MAR_2009_132]|uniref:triple tyrosine motif-containing protein n=1 Tax=Leeuwenhoekiella sp. MAR_2009_132 TaxID=1392489 RepID=UPI000689F3FA|nr:triple tyrosine motif-containing protein [Leeuwenhoekiella sp. MAR_2009_132]
MRFLNLYICIVIVLTFNFLNAQELPPVLNFSPDYYNAENQNWALAQDDSGYVYSANNSGLLQFDGAKWRLYPSPNNTIIRSVATVGKRVYTGSYMQFGFWEEDHTGKLVYNSLSDSLKIPILEDEQFWNIIPLDQWVIFQSLNRIYSYNTKTKAFEVITNEATISKSLLLDGKIYFQSTGEGLFCILNGKKTLVSDSSVFKDKLLVNLFKVANYSVAVTQHSGFYKLVGDEISTWNTSADQELLDKTIYSSKQLKDKTLIVGTISNGVYHLSENGTILYQINQNAGLINNTVLSINEDRNANVWLGLDRGIALINSNSPYRVYKDNSGELGAVYSAVVNDSTLYLGTNQGLFYRDLYKPETAFKLVPNTKGQVWFLKKLGDDLFCGHHEGTFLVIDNRVERISSVQGTWQIQWLNEEKKLALQGNYNGLYVLEKKGDDWSVRNKVEGFNISSRYFGLADTYTLYVSHEYKGVFKLEFDKNYQQIIKQELVENLEKGEKSGIVTYGDALIYASDNGIYKLTEENQEFIRDSVLSRGMLKNGNYTSGKLTYDEANKRLWGFNTEDIFYFEPGSFALAPKVTHISFSAEKRRDVAGFENITFLENNKYLLGNSSGYTILDLDKDLEYEYEIRLRSVQNGSVDQNLKNISLNDNSTFKSKDNNFLFNYSVTNYDTFKTVKFQYRLLGLYEEWSNWSSASQVSFENLPSGSYTFEVRARVGDQVTTEATSYTFNIKRPWYLSITLLIIYVILLLIIFITIHIFNRKFYKKQKQRLIEINARKIELSRYENERRIMQLENEKLIQDVESKNRELAASTMSIVKKNELLNAIKKELKPSNDDGDMKSVIKIIDKNLNPKKDWEFFSQAFNNADKDFLKKIKSKHPKLTPNDLKLCAYLRLNLSSKEIAPLLNISVRSVEIKRYRLRKKMDLEHEEGLVEYILSI